MKVSCGLMSKSLKETCDSWNITYNWKDGEIPEFTEEEQEALNSVLHTAGDSVGAVLGINPESPELRRAILSVVAGIFIETRERVQMAVEFSIMNHALKEPLHEGFTHEECFGENLIDALHNQLVSTEEVEMADEYLAVDDDEDEEYSE